MRAIYVGFFAGLLAVASANSEAKTISCEQAITDTEEVMETAPVHGKTRDAAEVLLEKARADCESGKSKEARAQAAMIRGYMAVETTETVD